LKSSMYFKITPYIGNTYNVVSEVVEI